MKPKKNSNLKRAGVAVDAIVRPVITDHPEWFFVWIKPQGKGYVTSICSWSRKGVIQQAEKLMGETWRKIYRKGGRALKLSLSLLNEPALPTASATTPQS